MKTDELYKRLDIFKDKIKQRLVELVKDDKIFLQEKEDEMYGNLRMNQKQRKEDLVERIRDH